MKTITRFQHACLRCGKLFVSASRKPVCCGKCKSPYWNRARAQKATTEACTEAKHETK